MEEKSFSSAIPSVSDTAILSSKVERSLNLGCGKALTLVTGMGGIGKTTSVAVYANRLKAKNVWNIIWLSVTSLDNGASRFWSQIVRALTAVHRHDSSTSDLLQKKLNSLDASINLYAIEELLDILKKQDCEYYIVIDDVHFINDAYILKALNHIFINAPLNLHFVLIGRTNPGISLYRLRMKDNVVEVGPKDLAFTKAEIQEFFQKKQILTLSPEHIEEIHNLTRGWAAGLQMIYLLLRKTKDIQPLLESFPKNNRWLLDFLVEEVLQTLDEETRDFLLRTCFLEKATQETYECVIGSINSQKAIDELLDMNLMLRMPTETNAEDEAGDTWYAYHPLFSESLRHCMEIEYQKTEISRMQAIACAWFESSGCYEQAIRIAIKAGDYETALKLITEHLYSVLSHIESGVLMRWLENLPHPQNSDDYLFPLINAWANFIAGKTKRSRMWLEKAYGMREKHEGSTAFRGTNKVFEAIEVGILVFAGEYEKALQLGRESLENLGGPQLFLRSTIMHNMGEALERIGRPEEAYEYFIRSQASAEKSGRRIISLLCSCEIGWIEYIKGNLDSSSSVYLKAINSFQHSADQETWAIGLLYVGLARLYLNWGDTKKASFYLDLAHGSLNPYTNKDGYLEAQVVISELQIMLGNFEDARDTMLAAYELLETDKTPRGVDILVPLGMASALLSVGQTDRASEVLEKVKERINQHDTYYLASWNLYKAQILIANNEWLQAIGLLRSTAHSAGEAKLGRLVQESFVLLACAQRGLGDTKSALATIAEALVLASDENLIMPFVGQTMYLKSLLYEVVHGNRENRFVAQEMKSAKKLALSALAIHREREKLLINCVPEEENADILSPREIQVCSLLKQGKTRKEISETLDIQLNTVRTHIRNIYRKTGIHDRSLL